jgi:histidinol dehydrogenase
LLTLSEEVADRVHSAITAMLSDMPRKAIIAESLINNGAIIVAANEQELIDVAEIIAPEHLEIFTENADHLAEQISNAGAIFIGPYSSESLGDYCAGPNHVLPTSGTARFSSPLGVYDFQKRSSMLRISKSGAQSMAKHAEVLAKGESLTAHAAAAVFRRDE